jgi:hypothetical protein
MTCASMFYLVDRAHDMPRTNAVSLPLTRIDQIFQLDALDTEVAYKRASSTTLTATLSLAFRSYSLVLLVPMIEYTSGQGI